MDGIDRVLLNAIQTGFPVEDRPYAVLGCQAGISETKAWERISVLRREGIIRRLGGVFDSHRLGYFSTLCAAKVPADKVETVSALLAAVPGVTHNYLRNHAYNMWFTLIASTEAKAAEILRELRWQSGVEAIYSLPAERLFKIKVDFDFLSGYSATGEPSFVLEGGLAGGRPSEKESRELGVKPAGSSGQFPGRWDKGSGTPVCLTERDIALIRLLQEDLPAGLEPYVELAEELGWTSEEVVLRTRALQEMGALRRFGAVLRHQRAGFTTNAMGVWQVPPDRAVLAGEIMAGFRAVSHCYQRPTLPDWPYNLFTMIHGRSAEECSQVMRGIARATGLNRYNMLFSIKELKKSSMKYFVDSEL